MATPKQRECPPIEELGFLRSVAAAGAAGMPECYRRIALAFREMIPCDVVLVLACNPSDQVMSLLASVPDVKLSCPVPMQDALTNVAIERQAVTVFDLNLSAPGAEYGTLMRALDSRTRSAGFA